MLTDEDLNEVYGWVDKHELSRPKKNMARDFSDGLMVAEIVRAHFDKIVDVHNYPGSHNVKQKFTNWDTLNRKVFIKLGYQMKPDEIDKIVNCKPEAIEKTLLALKRHIEETKKNGLNINKKPNNGDTSNIPHNGYTNLISPVETPAMMMINNQFSPMFMQPIPGRASYGNIVPTAVTGLLAGAHGGPHGGAHGGQTGAGRHGLPPDTPISKVPQIIEQPTHGTAHERRRSPVMQRAGLQAAGGAAETKGGKGRTAQLQDYDAQYSGMTTKQLIGVIREKDNRIQDLVETLEILELKTKKLDQLVSLKDAEIKVWQNR